MPLEILVAMVLIGIVVIAILLHVTGRSAPVLMTRDTAAKAWSRHDPDTQILNTWPSTLGQAALIETDLGLGLVWCFGADTIARPLAGVRLLDHPKGLKLRFADFATPSVVLHLSDAELNDWRRRIMGDHSAPITPTVTAQTEGQTHA
ncbi:hypothetical protein VWX97_01000 [Phaeobacter sp. JH18-32]|uniref:hypothetical protein n=1 Tax=Phaeobacter TaxID=302485 RepID=UPI003A86DE0A